MNKIISIKIAGQWTPVNTLPQLKQYEIKNKVVEVVQKTIKQQIVLILERER